MEENLSFMKGKPFHLCEGVFVHHPILDEIESCFEQTGYDYYSLLFDVISNPRDMADLLWCKQQIWYEDFDSDWSFFIQKAMGESRKQKVLFDFEGEEPSVIEGMALGKEYQTALNYFLGLKAEYIFISQKIEESNKSQIFLVATDEDFIVSSTNFKFTEVYYTRLVKFLRDINWLNPKYEFLKGGNRAAKRIMLEHDYKSKMKEIANPKRDKFSLGTILSCVVAKGVSPEVAWRLPIYFLYNIYYRNVKIEESRNTMSALYAGAIDMKKNPIKWEKVNWSSVLSIPE